MDEDMAVRSIERRRRQRAPAAYPVAIRDRRGMGLLRGRACDVSERGLMCVTESRRGLRVRGKVVLEITVPSAARRKGRQSTGRSVRYLARVVRTGELGQLVAVSVELIEKLT